MKKSKQIWLVFRALYALARYDMVLWLRGSATLLETLKRQRVATKTGTRNPEQAVCDAVLLATCLYWRPVLCLQRSVCTARLLRMHGINAHLVIGYRPSPFFSHAWVEVEGRVVYGSPAYQKRLRHLYVA